MATVAAARPKKLPAPGADVVPAPQQKEKLKRVPEKEAPAPAPGTKKLEMPSWPEGVWRSREDNPELYDQAVTLSKLDLKYHNYAGNEELRRQVELRMKHRETIDLYDAATSTPSKSSRRGKNADTAQKKTKTTLGMLKESASPSTLLIFAYLRSAYSEGDAIERELRRDPNPASVGYWNNRVAQDIVTQDRAVADAAFNFEGQSGTSKKAFVLAALHPFTEYTRLLHMHRDHLDGAIQRLDHTKKLRSQPKRKRNDTAEDADAEENDDE